MLTNLDYPTYVDPTDGSTKVGIVDQCSLPTDDQLLEDPTLDPDAYFTEYFEFDKLFSLYDLNLRVDSEGNPHFMVGIIPSGGDYIFPSASEANGFYHIWIDKDYLENPGAVNTSTGWNYSLAMGLSDVWGFSDDSDPVSPTGYYFITFPSLALSDTGDSMYLVTSAPEIRAFSKYQLPDNYKTEEGEME